MKYIGIDPGANGGMAIMFDNGSVSTISFNKRLYANVIAHLLPEFVIVGLERVHAMPGQGVTSMFSFGENYGFIQGLLAIKDIAPIFVEPRVWCSYYKCGSDKKKHIEKALEICPTLELRRTMKCKKEHDGMADAFLIANYIKETHQKARETSF